MSAGLDAARKVAARGARRIVLPLTPGWAKGTVRGYLERGIDARSDTELLAIAGELERTAAGIREALA